MEKLKNTFQTNIYTYIYIKRERKKFSSERYDHNFHRYIV